MTVAKVNGARHNWGPREVYTGAGVNKVDDVVQKVVVDFSFDKLPAAGDVGDAVVLELPAKAVILSAYLLVTKAFVGGTGSTVQIGTKKASDGTELDNDGFVTAANTGTDIASIDADGDVVIGSGAQIGKALAERAKIAVTAGGAALTAGEARLVVQYIHPGLGA